MSNYVISDIHGDKQKFEKMMKKINFSEKDTLYIIGDVVDRGSEPITLLNYILSQKNMVLLMGNHEKMMLEGVKNRQDSIFMDWLYNGGETTLSQFSELTNEEQKKLMDKIQELEYYKILDINGQKFLLCHAGLIIDSDNIFEDINRQVKNQRILWNRRELLYNRNNSDYIIVHGHTATCGRTWGGNGKIDFYDGERKINIDCGCGRGEKLGCLRLEDFREYYV